MLRALWPALEEVAGLEAVLAEWHERLGDAFVDLHSLLLPTDRHAEAIPVPGNPYAWYHVVWHSQGDIVGVHDSGEPTISLSKRDVLIYRVDIQRVIRNLAGALRFELGAEPIDRLPHTYQIGTYRPTAGLAFPAFLTFPMESADLQHTVEAILAAHEAPLLILAPTRRCLRPSTESLLKRSGGGFLALSEVIETDRNGKWVASGAGAQCLSAFRQLHVPDLKVGAAIALFPTPPNAKWSDLRIQFIDGETVSARVGSASGTFLYSQMGMIDGRNTKPTKQWELLRVFAESRGLITWKSAAATRANQKRREKLGQDLKKFFGIDGDPIEYVEASKGWRTLFTIESDC